MVADALSRKEFVSKSTKTMRVFGLCVEKLKMLFGTNK